MAAAARAVLAVKPHVPLIKFPSRQGSVPKYNPMAMTSAGAPSASPSGTPSTAPAASSKPAGSTPRGSSIDANELPLKYWRRPISAEEMEYIEKGGPV